MAVREQTLKSLEESLGTPVELAVGARRPGASRHFAGLLLIAAVLVVGFWVLTYKLTGYIFIGFLPLALIGAIVSKLKKPPPAEPSLDALPLAFLAIVTRTELVLAPSETSGAKKFGPIAARVPRDQITSVEPLGSKQVRIGLADGRSFVLVIVFRADRQLLLQAIAPASLAA